MKQRSFRVAVVVGAVLVLTACSSSDEKVTSVPATSSGSTAPSETEAPGAGKAALSAPIADAGATRDALLKLATHSTIIPNSSPDYGALQNWEPYLVPLGFQGSGVPATATSISGVEVVYSKTKSVSYLAFAVLDGAGNCAAGVVELADDVTVSAVAPIDGMTAAKCTGSDAAELGGY